jgi:hypothetical protein
VADTTTQACLAEAADAFASQLTDPGQPWFQQGWELLTMAEDPRSILASGSNGADQAFMARLRGHLKGSTVPFAVSPIPISEDDLRKVFPAGAPSALYRSETLKTARALRAAFGLPAMDVAKQVRAAGQGVTAGTVEAARQHVEELVKAVGRPPNEDEKWFIATCSAPPSPTPSPGTPAPKASTHSDGTEFPEVVAKWRTAELAPCLPTRPDPTRPDPDPPCKRRRGATDRPCGPA